MAMDRLDGSTTAYQVAADLGPKLGIGKESLRRWIIQAQVDAGQAPGQTTEERLEMRELRRQLREAEEVIEVLKAASVFFAGERAPENSGRDRCCCAVHHGHAAAKIYTHRADLSGVIPGRY